MLGLGSSLTNQGFVSDGPPSPITLASYASDFSSGVDGWQDAVASTTISGNNDGVQDKNSTSHDDCLQVYFSADISSSYQFWNSDVFASGGIVAGDTVSVSFKYLFQDPDSNTSGTAFRVQLGGYHSSRIHDISVSENSEDTWTSVTHEFAPTSDTSLNRLTFRWYSSSYYPKENNLFYLKDISVTHSGQAR